jgi:hypothetical protein
MSGEEMQIPTSVLRYTGTPTNIQLPCTILPRILRTKGFTARKTVCGTKNSTCAVTINFRNSMIALSFLISILSVAILDRYTNEK